MPSVTVPGTGTSTVTVPQSNNVNFIVAQQIANAIAAVTTSGGTLSVTTAGVGTTPPAAPTTPGTVGEIILTGSTGGGITIPNGYAFIVDGASAPVTITASNASILTSTISSSIFG